MKIDVDFYTKPLDQITREEIIEALDLARTTINRCSVALREQGYLVGNYSDGGVADKLSSAFARIVHAGDMITLLPEPTQQGS